MNGRIRILGTIDDTRELLARRSIERAHRAGADMLTILIHSEGGALKNGYRIATDLQKSGIFTTARALRHTHSAATIPFLLAKRRVVHADSVMTLHPCAVELKASDRETAASLRKLADTMQDLDDSYFSLIERRISPRFMHRDTFIRTCRERPEGMTINASFARGLGLADHVLPYSAPSLDAVRRLAEVEG